MCKRTSTKRHELYHKFNPVPEQGELQVAPRADRVLFMDNRNASLISPEMFPGGKIHNYDC